MTEAHCCQHDCGAKAMYHVQGYHPDVPDYDDCTHSCEAHLAEMTDYVNGTREGGMDASAPATVHALA